jgi:hypothetical protein
VFYCDLRASVLVASKFHPSPIILFPHHTTSSLAYSALGLHSRISPSSFTPTRICRSTSIFSLLSQALHQPVFIHSFTHSFIHSFTHSFIHSFIHSFNSSNKAFPTYNHIHYNREKGTAKMLQSTLVLIPALLASLALARTDISGCTTTIQGQMAIYYVPDTGELCEFLNCGGGRAPPKTDVPGCPLYSGTATYSPQYLAGFVPKTTAAASTPTSTAAAAVVAAPQTTAAPSTDAPVQQAAAPSTAADQATTDSAPAPTDGAQVASAASTVTSNGPALSTASPTKAGGAVTTSHGAIAVTGTTLAKTSAVTRTTAAASGTKSPLAATGAAVKGASFWMGSALLGLGAVAVAL